MKRKSLKKLLAAAVASVCAVNALFVSSLSSFAATNLKYEAEDATIEGSVMPAEGSDRWVDGASGDKFVFLEKAGEKITFDVTVEEAGMYEVLVGYQNNFGGAKIQNISINGVDQGKIDFPVSKDWTELSTGMKRLSAGTNTISIISSWGWTNIDYIRIVDASFASLPSLTNFDRVCCDPKATSYTQSLMNFLSKNYGSHVISGQQEIYKYGPHDFNYEFDYIKDTTGELPAIRGFDFLNCANILYGSDDGTVDRMIDWAKNKNGIVTTSWHLTVPKDFASYELGATNVTWNDATYAPKDTDFDASNVIKAGTKENEYYMACLKACADQIQKLQDAEVPLIFRPLHEAEGGGGEDGSWFWWGKSGSAVYKDIWKLTYETLTDTYGLHNIIWEWNSYNYSSSANWYPGDEYVDLIAYDKYNCTVYLEENNWQASYVHNDSAIGDTFYGIVDKYNGKKMVAMSENDSIPKLSNILEEKAAWLYFCPWYDGGQDNTNFLTNELFNKKEDLIEMYQSDYCITLDELPADLYGDKEKPTNPTEEDTNPTESSSSSSETKPIVTDENAVEAVVKPNDGKYSISVDGKFGDTVYLIFDVDKTITYANGCLGVSVGVDGTDYWVSYQWEAAKSGTIAVDLSKPFQVSYNNGVDLVVDEALIEPICEEAKKQNTGEVQIWWANDSAGEEADTSKVVLTGAYVIKEAENTDTTESSGTIVTGIPTLIGDVNQSGDVDLQDLVALAKYFADSNSYGLSATGLANADCTRDGFIGNPDVVALLQYVSGQVSEDTPIGKHLG